MMVPEGYRNYARVEGLDPYTYYQTSNQQSSPSHVESIESAGRGYSPAWKLLLRLFLAVLTSK